MLIPSYVIQLIYQNQNVTELDINWLLGKNRPILTFENWALKAIFHFT